MNQTNRFTETNYSKEPIRGKRADFPSIYIVVPIVELYSNFRSFLLQTFVDQNDL